MLQPNASYDCKEFAWAFDVGLEGIPTQFRLGKFARFYYDTRYNKACNIVHNYIAPIVQRAVARSNMTLDEKAADLEERGDKPVPLSARVATKNTFLLTGGGRDGTAPVFVPKGARVIYQVFSTHRRRDIMGDDAEGFKPERWETVRLGFGYLPVNDGPRICPVMSLNAYV